MNTIPINLAVEDSLSEAVIRVCCDVQKRFCGWACYSRGGYGYLKKP